MILYKYQGTAIKCKNLFCFLFCAKKPFTPLELAFLFIYKKMQILESEINLLKNNHLIDGFTARIMLLYFYKKKTVREIANEYRQSQIWVKERIVKGLNMIKKYQTLRNNINK